MPLVFTVSLFLYPDLAMTSQIELLFIVLIRVGLYWAIWGDFAFRLVRFLFFFVFYQ